MEAFLGAGAHHHRRRSRAATATVCLTLTPKPNRIALVLTRYLDAYLATGASRRRPQHHPAENAFLGVGTSRHRQPNLNPNLKQLITLTLTR